MNHKLVDECTHQFKQEKQKEKDKQKDRDSIWGKVEQLAMKNPNYQPPEDRIPPVLPDNGLNHTESEGIDLQVERLSLERVEAEANENYKCKLSSRFRALKNEDRKIIKVYRPPSYLKSKNKVRTFVNGKYGALDKGFYSYSHEHSWINKLL
uniref:Uncharacterized protein n=1 Tax=Rhodnius prolixus TaxID=13249 RepID=T1HVM4_RHOPR